jgi:hypothetical protein
LYEYYAGKDYVNGKFGFAGFKWSRYFHSTVSNGNF